MGSAYDLNPVRMLFGEVSIVQAGEPTEPTCWNRVQYRRFSNGGLPTKVCWWDLPPYDRLRMLWSQLRSPLVSEVLDP